MHLHWSLAIGVACLFLGITAQSPSEPIAGNYTGLWRPQMHFSPPKGFMNDPNGMHRDASGTWHLYYQCKRAEGRRTYGQVN